MGSGCIVRARARSIPPRAQSVGVNSRVQIICLHAPRPVNHIVDTGHKALMPGVTLRRPGIPVGPGAWDRAHLWVPALGHTLGLVIVHGHTY